MLALMLMLMMMMMLILMLMLMLATPGGACGREAHDKISPLPQDKEQEGFSMRQDECPLAHLLKCSAAKAEGSMHCDGYAYLEE